MFNDLDLEVVQLRKFKEYVHKRLDDAGIPTHPEGEHSKHGCRIGDRLDIALRTHQPVELAPESFNSHADDRLTKTGGMSFDMWFYILVLENKAHGNTTDGSDSTDWRDYYENDYTPHSAIEEDFNYA